ncbi:MAG: hypothetical protein GF347_04300 [Candidatus Moranbacteria bacterium]|nr:hypothetical protein [Candidatus Moranbacteria bacterium]
METKSNNQKNIVRENFFKDSYVRFYLIASLILNFIIWLFIFAKSSSLINPVILKYNAYFGVILEGEKKNIYALPLLGFFVILLNGSLASSLEKRYLAGSKILLATSLIFNIILLIAVIALMLVNKV